jgi:purine-binding chemotaxis protein CheW
VTGPPRQVCTFTLEGRRFGLDVAGVRSVLPWRPVRRVPRAPDLIEGLMSLRGEIVMAVDLRGALGLPKRPADARPMSVVLATPAGVVGLLVDSVGDVEEPGPESWESIMALPVKRDQALISGAFKTAEGLVLLLDNAAIVALCS